MLFNRSFNLSFKVLSLATILASILLTLSAQAYQCERPFREVKEENAAATAVFVGKVTKVHAPTADRRIPVTFAITQPLKGEPTPEATVSFNTLDQVEHHCNTIKVDETYLVYAFGKVGALSTDICTRGLLKRQCHRTHQADSSMAKDDIKRITSSVDGKIK